MTRRALATGACIAVLVACALLALRLGAEPIALDRALFDARSTDHTLLIRLRLPRALLAAIAGAGLAVVGAAFQALLRNPLAEPFVLGVSGGSAFGATLAIALGLGASSVIGAALVPVAAFGGGLAATWLVYSVARGAEGPSGTSILLAGVMVNATASALITFLKTLVTPSKAQTLLRWLTGFIDVPSALGLGMVAVYVGVGCVVLLLDGGRLNLLALGDETATTLGVDVRALERRVFIASSCIVGAIVSLTGLIGFVGLVVPHALRRIVGPDHRLLLPLSMCIGAAALLGCDVAARLLFRSLGTEPPVGAVTALVGGPAFLVLLKRSGAAR